MALRRLLALAVAACVGAAAAAPPRPQDDLYGAVNGAWLDSATIAPHRAETGTFEVLRDQADARVRAIADALAARADDDALEPAERRIATFWRSFLDTDAIDRAGLAPLAPWLAELDAAEASRSELAALMGRWVGRVAMPLDASVEPDAMAPARYAATLAQGGLGLPDRDAYRSAQRHDYLRYLEALFREAGRPDPAGSAAIVLALETRLAQAQWPEERNQDPRTLYNPLPVSALARRAPGFDWPRFLEAAGLGHLDRVVLAQPSYVRAAAQLIARTPPRHWRLYLEARLLDRLAPVLPGALREAWFELHGRVLRGLAEPPPRWEAGLDALDDALGDSVGRLYVERHFAADDRARMRELVEHLLNAYRESITATRWMSAGARAEALRKLELCEPLIGYPDRWRDEAGLELRDGDALGNAMRAGRHAWEHEAARAGGEVDRAEWDVSPQTVNAYYDPQRNQIVFPAGILQPPLYDPAADDASNYGAIGAIIGHEISHGYDTAGSEFDSAGALRNWWTAADRRAYAAIVRRVVADYGSYSVVPGHHVNGRLTQNENMADLAGLQVSYRAMREARGASATLEDDRRFFEAWATVWREKVRDARALLLISTDPHASGPVRANANARNLDAYHQAYGTHRGDRMYKPAAARVRLW